MSHSASLGGCGGYSEAGSSLFCSSLIGTKGGLCMEEHHHRPHQHQHHHEEEEEQKRRDSFTPTTYESNQPLLSSLAPSTVSMPSIKDPGYTYLIQRPLVPVDHNKPHKVQVWLALRTPISKITAISHGLPIDQDDCSATQQVVIKVLSKRWLQKQKEHQSSSIGELAALKILSQSPSHPHVVPLIEAMEDSLNLYLVMPYAELGELFYMVQEHSNGLPEKQARLYFKQILKGMLHLKKHGLAHCDISLENVMLTKRPLTGPSSSSITSTSSSLSTFSLKGEEEEGLICRLIDLEMAHLTRPAAAATTTITATATTPPAAITAVPTTADQSHTTTAAGQSRTATAATVTRSPAITTTTTAAAAAVRIDADVSTIITDDEGEEEEEDSTARHDEKSKSSSRYSDSSNQQHRKPIRKREIFGKAAYVSPEGIEGGVINWHASDVWSLGIALFIMLTSRTLYESFNTPAFELLAQDGIGSLIHHYAHAYNIHVPPSAADLLCGMLRADPRKRMTLEEVALHPWLRG